MSNTSQHAKKELDILLKVHPDAIIADFVPEILALCEKFGNSGQSGGSAPYTASAIAQAVKKLCLHKPLAPLTGEDDEWGEAFDKDGTKQNKRLGGVFKNKEGKCYFLDAIIWQGQDDWDTFTGTINGITSRQYIKSFPFEYKTFHIDVIREGWNDDKHDNGGWEKVGCGPGPMAYKIKDKKQLEEVFEYYDKYSK